MFTALFVLAAIVILAIAGALFHKRNIDSIYKKVSRLSAAMAVEAPQQGGSDGKKREEARKSFSEFLYNPQGSTFNALAISAWLLLFVGIAFTFFLTPQISEWSFLKMPSFVSSSLGLFFFGLLALIAGLIIVVVLRLPDVYSMYIIPRSVKKAIVASWLLLLLPIFISAYIAVLYPYAGDLSHWINVAFIALVISQIILLSPIYIKALGVKI